MCKKIPNISSEKLGKDAHTHIPSAGPMTDVDHCVLANTEPHESKDPHDPDTLPLRQLVAFIIIPAVLRQELPASLDTRRLRERESRLELVLVQALKDVGQSTWIEVVEPPEPPPNCKFKTEYRVHRVR